MQAKWACPLRLPRLAEQKLDGKGLESDPLRFSPSIFSQQTKQNVLHFFHDKGKSLEMLVRTSTPFPFGWGGSCPPPVLCSFHCSRSAGINPWIGNCRLGRSGQGVAAVAVAEELCSGDPAVWTWILQATGTGKTPLSPRAARKYAPAGEALDYCVRKL